MIIAADGESVTASSRKTAESASVTACIADAPWCGPGIPAITGRCSSRMLAASKNIHRRIAVGCARSTDDSVADTPLLPAANWLTTAVNLLWSIVAPQSF